MVCCKHRVQHWTEGVPVALCAEAIRRDYEAFKRERDEWLTERAGLIGARAGLEASRNEALASFRSAQRSLGAIDQELGLGLDATLAETLAEIKRFNAKHDAVLEDLGGAILKLNAIRLALGMPAPANHDWREPKVVEGVKALAERSGRLVVLLLEARGILDRAGTVEAECGEYWSECSALIARIDAEVSKGGDRG